MELSGGPFGSTSWAIPAAARPKPTSVPALRSTVREARISAVALRRPRIGRERGPASSCRSSFLDRREQSRRRAKWNQRPRARTAHRSRSKTRRAPSRVKGRAVGHAHANILLRLDSREGNRSVAIARGIRGDREKHRGAAPKRYLTAEYCRLPHAAGFTPLNVVVAVTLIRTL